MNLSAQSQPILLLSTILGAAAIGVGLHKLGDAEMRSWSIPGAVAILIGGIGYTFYLPSIVTIPVFLAALYFLHRNARQRQEKAVAALKTLGVESGALSEGSPLGALFEDSPSGALFEDSPSGGLAFMKVGKLPPGVMGHWREAPRMEVSEREPMTLSVSFVGEKDDEYQVIVSARVEKFVSGMLFVFHEDCDKKFQTTLTDQAPLTGLTGQPANLVFKAMPPDYVLEVLNISMVARLSELLELRKGEREIVLHASGPEVRLISNRILEEDELKLVFEKISLLADKIRELGAQERLY